MTFDMFFWYVFPWLASAAVFGWIAYDRYIKSDRLHPGE